MNAHKGHLLLVDDDSSILEAIGGLLERRGYRVGRAGGLAAARGYLSANDRVDVVVLDLKLHGENGLALLDTVHASALPTVIVLSGSASPTEAARSIKLGASEFVEKTASPLQIVAAIESAAARSIARAESVRPIQGITALVGQSTAMERVRQAVQQLAASRTSVLLLGETGTGKEIVARSLHQLSQREGRFVSINCAAIPDALAESELFGFERGAFSGAIRQHKGRIEQAHNGTLLLDEVGEMRPDLQAKLLRVLEDRAVERLGGTRPVDVDVRFIAATHRNLPQAIQTGAFRADFYYRLRVAELSIPPLRERPEDLLPLVQHFVAQVLGAQGTVEITDDGKACLRAHSWPGNVRELRNVVERLGVAHQQLSPGRPLQMDARAIKPLLTEQPTQRISSVPPETPKGTESEQEGFRARIVAYERNMLREALDSHRGNVAATARTLGIDRGQLYRRLQALGLLDRSS